jgi:hypothetical protein
MTVPADRHLIYLTVVGQRELKTGPFASVRIAGGKIIVGVAPDHDDLIDKEFTLAAFDAGAGGWTVFSQGEGSSGIYKQVTVSMEPPPAKHARKRGKK